MEELEQALKKYNMGDAKTIREIIAEVDTDNVPSLVYDPSSFSLCSGHTSILYCHMIHEDGFCQSIDMLSLLSIGEPKILIMGLKIDYDD